ncbi:MAG TPA: type IV pilus assembly protein PilM [Actinomycetes bacterium]|nr:type IV pilus assembly protein PilM [Actinomycetes bacterium]
MGRNVVGLDIGTTAVRAAELSTRRGRTVLERFGEVALPVGAVVDGEVVAPDVVAVAIRQLWRRVRFGSRQVVMGVANQRVVVRLVDLPSMDAEELRGSLRFQVQEHIPIPVEDAELDFNVLGEHEGGTGQRLMRVLLVAAQKDMIAGHLRASAKAGLKPVSIDLIPFALVRSLAPEGSAPLAEAGEALIDVGSAVTNIVVHENGTPRFVRILLMGGGDITDALRKGLALDHEGAEHAKLAVAADTSRDKAVDRIVEQRVAEFVQEVQGSLDFYWAQAGAVPIRRVLLTGGGSRLPSLGERLRDVLRLPVEPGRTLEAVRLGRLRRQSGQLADIEPVTAVPVGLALGGVS